MLCFATNNEHKIQEVRAHLGPDFSLVGLAEIGCREELPEEQTTLEGNSRQKAEYVFEHYGIERLLRAIDWQFSLSGADFVPEMKVLSAALATTPPEQFKNVKLKITPIVNAWLKEHS